MTQVSDLALQSVAANSNGTARILIVDDEQYMCDICARTLQSSAYHVMATTDVNMALQELRSSPYDLLLADIKMPTMSGLELARQAREVDPAIAIIIMTGHTSIENLQQAVRRGIADFLAKPFELEELRLAVDQALHKRRLLQDSLRLQAVEQLLLSSKAINATLDRNALSQIILQTALHHTGCVAGFLLLCDARKQLIETLASPDLWHLLEAGQSTALNAFQSGQPIFVEQAEPLCSNGERQIGRGLAIPVSAQGDSVGVLLLCDDQPGSLRPGTQEMASLLANQAGTALRNAHLYGELEEAYQRLQELDRLKSEFIAIASHELRTPLSIVLGYTTMVRDQSDGERRQYAQRVLDSAQHIKDIVDAMVNLRHMELGQITINLERCNLQHLVQQAVERMQPAAQQKQHTLTVDMPAEPITFMADREKVLLILGNLLSNAIKFTPNRGTITVSTMLWARDRGDLPATGVALPSGKVWPVPNSPTTMWAIVQVQDTGIGIPERQQLRIFDRFYQVADSLTRAQGGAGLGLAIVRELVTLQGGTVWVESAEGQGSTFSIALPYRTQ